MTVTDEQRPVPRLPRRRPHRALVIGAVLGALVIAAECIAITLQTVPRPALSSAALQPVLSSGPRSVPALTWTNSGPAATGSPLDLARSKPVLVAACEGGGSISIALSATAGVAIDCSHSTTAGPLVLDGPRAGAIDRITVEVTAGNPRYIVELRASTGSAARS